MPAAIPRVPMPRQPWRGDYIMRQAGPKKGLVGRIIAYDGHPDSGRFVVAWEDGAILDCLAIHIHATPKLSAGFLLLGRQRRAA